MYTDTTFIYIGSTEDVQNIAVPEPSVGQLNFSETVNELQATNANGVKVSHQIGEAVMTQEIGWDIITAAKWWELGQFFRNNGTVFWCRFFDHNTGEWRLKRFRRGDLSADLLLIDADGNPEYYSASFRIESIGD